MANLDSVFALSAEDELNFDVIFGGDEDDALCEAVEGFDEDGNSLLGDATFDELHQTDDDGVTAKDIKDELEGDQNLMGAKDVEGTDKLDLDDSNTIKKLEGNGESDIDKFLDDAEDEYQNDEKPTIPNLNDEEVTPDIEKGIGEATNEFRSFLEEVFNNSESDADKFYDDAEDEYQDDDNPTIPNLNDEEVTPDIEKGIGETAYVDDFMTLFEDACPSEGPLGDKEDFEYDPESEKVSDNSGDFFERELAVSDTSVAGIDSGDLDDGEAIGDAEDDYPTSIDYTSDDEEELIKMVEGK